MINKSVILLLFFLLILSWGGALQCKSNLLIQCNTTTQYIKKWNGNGQIYTAK